jgi:predicted nucleic acid-binding Zn ribbon protein
MATTLGYVVLCLRCGKTNDVILDDLADDPRCELCGMNLGRVVRIEGFQVQPKSGAE